MVTVSIPFGADCADIFVRCEGCSIHGPMILVDIEHDTNDEIPGLEADAVAAWNRRAASDGLSPSEAWQELVEKDDRTSPSEYPDMALITREELAEFMDTSRSRAAAVGKADGLLRAILAAQVVEPYRGWNITNLNMAADAAREYLGQPSIRDLNPDLAAIQDAAEANKAAFQRLVMPDTPLERAASQISDEEIIAAIGQNGGGRIGHIAKRLGVAAFEQSYLRRRLVKLAKAGKILRCPHYSSDNSHFWKLPEYG